MSFESIRVRAHSYPPHEDGDGPETSADEILKTLDQIYDEAINAKNTVPTTPTEEMDDYDGDDYVDEQPESTRVKKKSRKGNTGRTKKVMNPLMGEDVYELGKQELTETDVVAVRANLRRHLDEKIELRECNMQCMDLQTNPPTHQ